MAQQAIYPIRLLEHELIYLKYSISFQIQMVNERLQKEKNKKRKDKGICDYLAAETEAASEILERPTYSRITLSTYWIFR